MMCVWPPVLGGGGTVMRAIPIAVPPPPAPAVWRGNAGQPGWDGAGAEQWGGSRRPSALRFAATDDPRYPADALFCPFKHHHCH